MAIYLNLNKKCGVHAIEISILRKGALCVFFLFKFHKYFKISQSHFFEEYIDDEVYKSVSGLKKLFYAFLSVLKSGVLNFFSVLNVYFLLFMQPTAKN